MIITDIGIERSLMHARAWKMHVEIGGCRFDGYFEDFGGFITAVTECAKFFSVRAGLLRVKDAKFTREVQPGGFGFEALPGDKTR